MNDATERTVPLIWGLSIICPDLSISADLQGSFPPPPLPPPPSVWPSISRFPPSPSNNALRADTGWFLPFVFDASSPLHSVESFASWSSDTDVRRGRRVCLLVGCLTSQQHASVSQGRICTDNCTCCHTEIGVADQTFHFTQSQYTDTGPTSPSADPITPGAWQGSHWSANV